MAESSFSESLRVVSPLSVFRERDLSAFTAHVCVLDQLQNCNRTLKLIVSRRLVDSAWTDSITWYSLAEYGQFCSRSVIFFPFFFFLAETIVWPPSMVPTGLKGVCVYVCVKVVVKLYKPRQGGYYANDAPAVPECFALDCLCLKVSCHYL